MDINDLMKIGKEYESLFEAHLQKPPESVKGGSYGSMHSLVFFTGTGKDRFGFPLSMDQMDLRDMEKDSVDVRLKFHQANQIPHIIEDASYLSSSPLKLKSGYEYVIEVRPKIIEMTSGFQKLNIEHRIADSKTAI